MWLKTIVLVGCVVATLAADKQPKKKEDTRGKRQYSLPHHYGGPHAYRRISTGPQIPLYHSQFFPGPRPYSPFHKGRPHSLPPPPYAVQMEPLVHYSQRDPLYDTNALSLNADGQDDLLTDNNHLSETYGPQKQIVERPVYIKEPEPIIEIIIKESNVTLPPPPAPPTPPPKKKEQVQVFYVKYKKNPNGHGKESIVYDKPVAAISPEIHDEQEEAPPPVHHHEVVTSPPPPSTTLRTIIRPDSETYHSPSGVKVTFGKEGFDYDKRSSKPEDLKASSDDSRSAQIPQGRQLSSFPPSAPKHPPPFSFESPTPNFRQPQPYRPFSSFRQPTSQSFPRPSSQEYSTLPKFPLPQSLKSSQSFPPPRPVPPQYYRQPVPYQPFESLRQPPQFRPETHFPITQSPPITQKPVVFNQFNQQRPQFAEAKPEQKPQYQQPGPQYQHQQSLQHRPPAAPQIQPQPQPTSLPKPQSTPPQIQHSPQYQQSSLSQYQRRPSPSQQQTVNQYQQQITAQQQLSLQHQPSPQFSPQHQQSQQFNPQLQHFNQQQPQHQQFTLQHAQQFTPQQQQLTSQHQQLQQFNPQNQQSEQFNPHQLPIIPPGGELIQSVPKYEQHISGPLKSSSEFQFPSNQPPHLQPQLQQSSIQLNPSNFDEKSKETRPSQLSDYNDKIQQQLRAQSQNQQTSNEYEKIQQQLRAQSQNQQTSNEYEKIQQQLRAQSQNQQRSNEYDKIQQQLRAQSQNQQSSNDYNDKIQQQLRAQSQNQQSSGDYSDKIQQQLREANALQESIRQSSPQFYNFQQSQQLNFYQTTSKPSTYSTTPTTTSTTTTQKPSTTTKDPKVLNAQLPDEVPDDLREQLLSSGILNHADISVLDYDKVGDIPLSALPPDQLANFYNAGGAQQIQAAGSDPVPAIANRELDTEASEIHEVKVKPEVQMKVVRYDPESDKGQQVQDEYVKEDATQVDPVALNDEKYNRYLPLKISGAQFPIPDVPELKGKKITSVVVLAPVAYDFSSSRQTREAKDEEIDLLKGQHLKILLKEPTQENFKKFLEQENKTKSDQQAVILLVAKPSEDAKDKEIFMYDVATQTVSKLDGELSTAFVEAAEANSGDTKASASGIVETRIPYDLTPDGSENIESYVDVSGNPIEDDLTASETHLRNKIALTKTGRSP